MTIDWGSIIEALKTEAVKKLTAQFMAKLTPSLPRYLIWTSPVIERIVGLGIAFAMKYVDWGVYLTLSQIDNSADGKKFEDAYLKLRGTQPGTPENEKAKQDVKDAFDDLFDARGK